MRDQQAGSGAVGTAGCARQVAAPRRRAVARPQARAAACQYWHIRRVPAGPRARAAGRLGALRAAARGSRLQGTAPTMAGPGRGFSCQRPAFCKQSARCSSTATALLPTPSRRMRTWRGRGRRLRGPAPAGPHVRRRLARPALAAALAGRRLAAVPRCQRLAAALRARPILLRRRRLADCLRGWAVPAEATAGTASAACAGVGSRGRGRPRLGATARAADRRGAPPLRCQHSGGQEAGRGAARLLRLARRLRLLRRPVLLLVVLRRRWRLPRLLGRLRLPLLLLLGRLPLALLVGRLRRAAVQGVLLLPLLLLRGPLLRARRLRRAPGRLRARRRPLKELAGLRGWEAGAAPEEPARRAGLARGRDV